MYLELILSAVESANARMHYDEFKIDTHISLATAYIKIFNGGQVIFNEELQMENFSDEQVQRFYKRALQNILIHGLSNLASSYKVLKNI